MESGLPDSPVFRHVFVDAAPETLQAHTLYVSLTCATVIHLCPCGCGSEVVTPISPTDWRLEFDGKSISLFPSVGNWTLPCKSHYIVTRNRIRWAGRWTEQQIRAGRDRDQRFSKRYFGRREQPPETGQEHASDQSDSSRRDWLA